MGPYRNSSKPTICVRRMVDMRTIARMRRLNIVGIWIVVLGACLCGFAKQGKVEQNGPLPAKAGSTCDQACLTSVMNHYLDALVEHDSSSLPFAKSVKCTENTKPIAIGEGTWKTVKFMKFHGETVADSSTGQAFYMGAVQEDYVSPIFVRLKIAGGKITEVETVISHGSDPQVPAGAPGVVVATSPTTSGGPGIGAPDLALLAVVKPFLESLLPEGRRVSRARLTTIANSYFDGLQGTTKNVPFASGCNRIENGNLTTNNPGNSGGGAVPAGCKEQFNSGGFHYIERVRDRRFLVVDEARGLILAQVVFDVAVSPTNRRSNVLNELFKIESGQISLLQAVYLWREPYGTKSGWN
jgi:hypothetical protein